MRNFSSNVGDIGYIRIITMHSYYFVIIQNILIAEVTDIFHYYIN